ncbi:MAG: hypothetical protein PHV93_04565 [Candidatus Pacebacteria bacterium]|nr:hypothetical protein [Candidatus Paceibacterota bacterium]
MRKSWHKETPAGTGERDWDEDTERRCIDCGEPIERGERCVWCLTIGAPPKGFVAI